MAAGGSAGVVSTKGQQLAELTGSTDHSGGLIAGQGPAQGLHKAMGDLGHQLLAIDTSTL
jgi:hypothetical protein